MYHQDCMLAVKFHSVDVVLVKLTFFLTFLSCLVKMMPHLIFGTTLHLWKLPPRRLGETRFVNRISLSLCWL